MSINDSAKSLKQVQNLKYISKRNKAKFEYEDLIILVEQKKRFIQHHCLFGRKYFFFLRDTILKLMNLNRKQVFS